MGEISAHAIRVGFARAGSYFAHPPLSSQPFVIA
jgi:hypothetical protein